MTLNRPNTITFVVLVVLALVVGFCRPARAHTAEEQAAWMVQWEDRAIHTGYPPDLLEELSDFIQRHTIKPSTGSGVTPHRPDPVEPHAPGVEQWRPLVAAYFPADQVDRALRIMGCESGGNPNAHNPSGASGLFQMMPHWYQGRSAYPAFDPFNPEANVAAAAWLWGQSGWAPWVCQ